MLLPEFAHAAAMMAGAGRKPIQLSGGFFSGGLLDPGEAPLRASPCYLNLPMPEVGVGPKIEAGRAGEG